MSLRSWVTSVACGEMASASSSDFSAAVSSARAWVTSAISASAFSWLACADWISSVKRPCVS